MLESSSFPARTAERTEFMGGDPEPPHQNPAGDMRWSASLVVGPSLLIAIYLGIVLAPILLAYLQELPPRNWMDEFSTALALAAFAGLLIEFVLSGRFRVISGHLGIDTTMRFHQLMARTFTIFLLVHPYFYVTPLMNTPLPWDTTMQYTLGLTAASLATGFIAWVMLNVMVLLAVFREQRHGSYERWRLIHGVSALVIALAGAHHTFNAGRYSGDVALFSYWSVLLVIAFLTLLWVYVIKPLWQIRNPYSIHSVRQIAERTWELVITPKNGNVIDFLAGQFVWLKVGRSPFSLHENPFSIASAPANGNQLSFIIKEVGDFTRSVGQIKPGTTAYIEGPHGNLTLQNRQGEGIALIAGGVGIAPLLGILRQLCHDQDQRPIVLFYGNRIQEQIAYLEEIDRMKEVLDLRIEHILGEPPQDWQGRTGVIDVDSLSDCLTWPDAENWLYFVCGPLPMIENVEAALLAKRVPYKQIVSERFYYD